MAAEKVPGAMPVDPVLEQITLEDQTEWEYEYSTTETEVYYLTVELSYPEFKTSDRQSTQPPGRAGYSRDWARTANRHQASKGTKSDESITRQEAGNSPGPSDRSDVSDDDDQAMLHPALRDKGKRVDRSKERDDPAQDQGNPSEGNKGRLAKDRSREDIQILDLHSEDPIISYRGRVFKGQWAEVVGTEMIFADRNDPDSHNLPALRHLPGDVDLLAASSCRLMTTEQKLVPRVAKVDSLAATKAEWNIRIPRGTDRTGERGQQTTFLENLIALKKQRGHTDNVTVYARAGAGKDFPDSKDPDIKTRKRQPPKASRARTRADAGAGPSRRSRRSRQPASDRATRSAESQPLSKPTPGQWDDGGGRQVAARSSTAPLQEEEAEMDTDEDMDDADEYLE